MKDYMRSSTSTGNTSESGNKMTNLICHDRVDPRCFRPPPYTGSSSKLVLNPPKHFTCIDRLSKGKFLLTGLGLVLYPMPSWKCEDACTLVWSVFHRLTQLRQGTSRCCHCGKRSAEELQKGVATGDLEASGRII